MSLQFTTDTGHGGTEVPARSDCVCGAAGVRMCAGASQGKIAAKHFFTQQHSMVQREDSEKVLNYC